MMDRELTNVVLEMVAKLDRMELRQVLSSKKFISLHELSIYLDVKMETVYALNKSRELTIYGRNTKMKYYKREEVDAWIELGGALRLSKYSRTKKMKIA